MASLIHHDRLNPATGQVEPYWRISWREGGRQCRTALGFISQPDAQKALQRWRELERNAVPDVEPPTRWPGSSAPPPRPPVPTVAEFWGAIGGTSWPESPMLRWVSARGFAHTTHVQADAARRWIVRELGAHRLDAVTPGVVDGLLVALRTAKRRSRTCQIYLSWLKRSLQVALDEGLIEKLPRIQLPADTDRKISKWLMPDQTAQLFAELERRRDEGTSDDITVLAIRMQETLLMRPGEVLHRRWSDLRIDRLWKLGELHIRPVQRADGTIWNPKRSGRRSSARTVAVPPILLGHLRDYWLRSGQPTDGWMFPGVDGKPRGSFKKALANACAAIGAPILTPHGLRHTGATRLAISGVERRTLMAIGGWSTSETLDEIYSHTSDARVAAVLTAAEVGAEPVPQGVPQPVADAAGGAK